MRSDKLHATIAWIDYLRAELVRWDALSPIEKKGLLRLAIGAAWVRGNALVAIQPTVAFLPLLRGTEVGNCGEGGIRTHGGDKPHNGFRDRPIQPLWHLSNGNSGLYYTKCLYS